MAAGGSDPRAGDVEEDASQLIFPKGGGGVASGLALPTLRPRPGGGRQPGGSPARRGAGRLGDAAVGGARAAGCLERGQLDSTVAALET